MADTHKKKFNFKLFFRSTLLFVLIGVVGVALITAAKNGWDFISKPQFEDDDDVVQYESLDPVDKKSGKLTMLLAGTDAGGCLLYTSGIAFADAMFGEITERMAASIARSGAHKVFLPTGKCKFHVAGCRAASLTQCLDDAVELVSQYLDEAADNR